MNVIIDECDSTNLLLALSLTGLLDGALGRLDALALTTLVALTTLTTSLFLRLQKSQSRGKHHSESCGRNLATQRGGYSEKVKKERERGRDEGGGGTMLATPMR